MEEGEKTRHTETVCLPMAFGRNYVTAFRFCRWRLAECRKKKKGDRYLVKRENDPLCQESFLLNIGALTVVWFSELLG